MMNMRPKCAINPLGAVRMPLRTAFLPAVLISVAVVALPSPNASSQQRTPYPSPRANLDDSHRGELILVIEDGKVTDEELNEAAAYLASVHSWADQVSAETPAETPEAQKLVVQATWYNAAVQEAFGMIQTTYAVDQGNPGLVGELLRRGFDDAAYGSALNWVGDGINPLVNGMDMADRGAMARVLSRTAPISYLNAASIDLLRATLPPHSSQASAFAERYPM